MDSQAAAVRVDLFLGEYEHTLDPQGRVSLPSEWRGRDGETELVMIPARGRALLLLPLESFLDFVKHVRNSAIANAKLQSAFAFLGANSRRCRCDRQGRIALDRKMLDSIGVGRELKLIGAVTHIMICSPGEWVMPNGGEAQKYLDEIQSLGDGEGGLAGLLEGILKK